MDIKKTVDFPSVLYGKLCEWSLTLRYAEAEGVPELGAGEDGVTGEWRRLHEVFTDQYCSPKTFRLIKSRRMGWAGHVTRTGDRVGACRVLVGDLRERGSLQDLLVDGTNRLIITKQLPAEKDECGLCFLNYYTAKSVGKGDRVCCQECNVG
jgi:hypothetical protein